MKKLLLTIIVSLASTFVMAYSIASRQIIKSPIELEPERPLALIISPTKVKIKIPLINLNELFLTSIGRRESSNRYNIVNKWGYMGKYQFGRKTLNALGYKNISNEQFLANHKLQEEAMLKLLKHNKHILRREIKKYCGTEKHGVYITESGLLAAAHLAGPGNVKKWLRRGKRFRDGLGTDLVEYLVLFGNYKINV